MAYRFVLEHVRDMTFEALRLQECLAGVECNGPVDTVNIAEPGETLLVVPVPFVINRIRNLLEHASQETTDEWLLAAGLPDVRPRHSYARHG